jgi:PAS domain S-box-containing protein
LPNPTSLVLCNGGFKPELTPSQSGCFCYDGSIRVGSWELSVPEQNLINRSVKELADIKHALDEAAIVAITDAEGKIISVNDTFCEISQYSRQELIGQDHRMINSGYHSKQFFKELWDIIQQGKVWKGEIKNRAKDGSYYWVNTTIVPFLNEAQQPYQYIAIRKDITYRKRLEDELRILNEGLEQRVQTRTLELEKANRDISNAFLRLQESERLRETFISALTHDLRTPLVAEQRALDLLNSQTALLPEKFQGLMTRLLQSNHDLLEMVNKLLTIYQYEAGHVRLNIEPVRIATLVQNSINQLAHLAETKQLTLENGCSDIIEMPIDSEQVARLLINLLGNAIQHLQTGGLVKVMVLDAGPAFELRIADNGPGIPSNILPHLFDRYFSMGQNKKKIGTGLGLSICKMIAKLHGGSIRVKSQLGEGTTFYVVFPKR